MRTSNEFKTLKVLGGAAAMAGAVALAVSCGGGGGDDDAAPPVNEQPTAIDTAGVTSAITDFGGLVAVCQDGTTGVLRSAHAPSLVRAILIGSPVLRGSALGLPTERPQALGTTPPADQLGSCGGRYGYRNYSHLDGVTRATLAFEGYCQLDSDTGDKQTMNGGITFVNTATPTATGPITTQLEASTSTALTSVTKNAAGTVTSAQTTNFTAFKMVVGVPGGAPTAAKPNVISMGEITVRNDANGKVYRETNYALTQYVNEVGNTEWTMTGRGYRSAGTYFDIATTQPMVQSTSGDILSGKIAFTGANGSNAVATVVPASTLQVKMTINGTALTSVPACATR
ncbi:MAG: hypothetical protein Q8K96_18000 [Rubrivivax sp.]|nr:hypothetical protein [Rubrivivax sp.]